MTTTMVTFSIPIGLGTLALCLLFAAGCTSASGHQPAQSAGSAQSMTSNHLPLSSLPLQVEAPPTGTSTRIGGDLMAMVTGSDADFRAGACRVDTPLPVGYPAPTPPGSIDLKSYPSVRIAEVSAAGDPDGGMNKMFRPLFDHIKTHDIAMTSPVEMNYRGMTSSDQSAPESWSMAFMYRHPELNRTGVEGQVVVRDTEPVTVVAVGLKGSYSMSLVQRGMLQIEDWLAGNPQWEPAGNWRALYYNGPTLFWWNKWAEVQIPVRKSAGDQRTVSMSNGDRSGLGPDR